MSQTLQSINPATGEVIKTLPMHTDAQVQEILCRAETAFQKQKKTELSERSAKMHCVAEHLTQNTETYAKTMTQEMGKTYVSAIAEVKKCADLCHYYADHAEEFMKDDHREIGAKQSYVRYLPMGTILAVMPWNFPLWQVFRFAVPAIMAGNSALLKHASNVPQCALLIEEAFREAGFADYEFQTLLIGSNKVADIIADRRIAAVTLTGSEKAGIAVAQQAGKHIKKAVLELGGSDPFIIMPSADLDQAIDLAVLGRVQNNGQTCIAAKRYIIHKDIYEQVKDKLIARFKALNVGNPMEEKIDIGPLATPSIRAELAQQVKDTCDKGADLLCGAEVIEGAGNYYRPGLLENIPTDSPAYRDELFGPVGLLFKVLSMDEAITLANDTRFGLGSVLCTQDEAEIDRAVNEIEAGAIFINAITASDPRLPFGGIKDSGYGRELSAEGMHEFMNIKTVVVR